MNFLLISGPMNCGKSTLIKNLYNYYLANGYVSVYYKLYNKDFTAVIEKNGRQVLIQSDTDLPGCVLRLKNYVKNLPTVDTVITASRNEPDFMRLRLFSELSISAVSNHYAEVPLGRMPSGSSRTTSVAWYGPQIEKIAIIVGAGSPFLL